nr:MAG TPA: hypothetical protein [Caudoviricetes sp.]
MYPSRSRQKLSALIHYYMLSFRFNPISAGTKV